MPEGGATELVCLLSVGDGEDDLPSYLDSVSRFADAVVAQDDGRTAATSDVLRRHPLVKMCLPNPRRETDSDRRNADDRNRLLAAAAALHPKWILSLDGDERITPDDATALRDFLRGRASRGAAYGFRVQETGASRETTSDDQRWAYRLFSYRNGQRFPPSASRAALVPTDIPREHWIKTTLHIRTSATCVGTSRPSGLAVVEGVEGQALPLSHVEVQRSFDQPLDPSRPSLSAIVISQDDRERIQEVMDALVSQEVDQPVELILVNSGQDGTAEFVGKRYPQVRVVHLPEPALPGKARNAGLRIATGDFVTFPGSHIVLPPGSLQKRLDAHDNGYAMVCGAVLNGTDTRAGWASYFLDHAVSLPGRPSRVLRLPPARCSYSRGLLIAIGGFPEDRRVGEDTVVNSRLFELGYRAYYSSDVQCVHKTPCTTVFRLVRHHYERGLGFGRILWEQAGQPQRLRSRRETLRWLVTTYSAKRVRFIRDAVRDWGETVHREFTLSFPLVLAGVASAAAGAILFLLRPRAPRVATPLTVTENRITTP